MKGAYQVKFPQKIISSLVDAYFELYHMYKCLKRSSEPRLEDLYTAVWYEQVLEDYFLLLEWFDGLEYMEEEYLEDSGDESFETVIDMDDAEEFKDKGVFDKEDNQEHIVKDVLVPVLEPVFYIKKEYIV